MAEQITHECQDYSQIPYFGYGPAIHTIIYDYDKKCWFTDNMEYSTVIQYCPFCGIKLSNIK